MTPSPLFKFIKFFPLSKASAPNPGKHYTKGLAFLLLLGGFMAFSVCAGFLIFGLSYDHFAKGLPEILIAESAYSEPTRIFDRYQKLLYENMQGERRNYVKFEEISPEFLKTILAAEDQRFFSHGGVDYLATLRAIWQNWRNKRVVGGGSTITQQLARSLFLNQELSFDRKIKEMILARKIEEKYSKKEILELYLNKINFGSNIYGIGLASKVFFGKDALSLNLAESAVLAILPRSPNILFPYKNKEDLFQKKDRLLKIMAERKFISEEEAQKALSENVDFQPLVKEISAPHFVFYVLDQLADIYDKDQLENGLETITTLDLELNQGVEKILQKYVLDKRRQYKFDNAAAIILDAKNGEILAMVGSYDFWDKEFGQHNAVLAMRQPGSTLKPFIYALALEKLHWRTDTVLEDRPMTFGDYSPQNFGRAYRGKATLETALVNSLNIPAVLTLNELGLLNTVKDLNRCGFGFSPEAGLSLAIGGASTNLLALSSSYTALANRGRCFEPQFFIKIKEKNNGRAMLGEGVDLLPREAVFDAKAVNLINQILKKTFANFYATKHFAQDSQLFNVSLKTGTSNGPRDFWAIGHNFDIIVGVWLGNHDNSLIREDMDALNLAVPLWVQIFKAGLARDKTETMMSGE